MALKSAGKYSNWDQLGQNPFVHLYLRSDVVDHLAERAVLVWLKQGISLRTPRGSQKGMEDLQLLLILLQLLLHPSAELSQWDLGWVETEHREIQSAMLECWCHRGNLTWSKFCRREQFILQGPARIHTVFYLTTKSTPKLLKVFKDPHCHYINNNTSLAKKAWINWKRNEKWPRKY